MNDRKDTAQHWFRIFLILNLLCVVTVFSSGCEPLRKKFTRKKKGEQKQEVIPVLIPIDYPPSTHSAKERYQYHYALWRVWDKELMQTMDKKYSDKKQRYLLEQIIVQLNEMKKWITSEKQSPLEALIRDFQQIQDQMAEPSPLRNRFSLKKKLELNAKKIRQDFNPRLLQDDSIP